MYERPWKKPVTVYSPRKRLTGVREAYKTDDRPSAYFGAVEVRPFQAKTKLLGF